MNHFEKILAHEDDLSATGYGQAVIAHAKAGLAAAAKRDAFVAGIASMTELNSEYQCEEGCELMNDTIRQAMLLGLQAEMPNRQRAGKKIKSVSIAR